MAGDKLRNDGDGSVRRAAKKDANHNLVADAFKAMGCSVKDTSRLGDDFPDMVVGLCGINVLIEVKRDEKAKLTDGQFKFFHEWKGWTAVVRSVDDVQKIVSQIKQQRAQEMRGFAEMQGVKV
jgi:hypothetical protein